MRTWSKSIGREAAITMFHTNWWLGKEPKEVARIGLSIAELCLPFDVLHDAVEKALGRPVWTHEFGLSLDAIWQELNGERAAPTLEEIINLIPVEKRVLVVLR